ncbi:MAG: thiamine diphosphokinase [Oscillospiraceae bacterium]
MKTCFIFGAGTHFPLHRRPLPGDFVIAADGGLLLCQAEGIVPDLLLGDFDSLPEVPEFPHILRVPVEKDDTDTMLAAKTGLEQGCTSFVLYGCTGGKRLDHTLANLQLLLFLLGEGAHGLLYDDDFVYTAIQNETLTIPRSVDWGLLSAFCLTGTARGVTETGVQYPLKNATLTSDFPLGVSNHILAEEAQVTVADGALLVGWELSPGK